MDDLTLVGVHDDGEHLLLVDAAGQRHRLKVDEALRAAVRRDRARLGQLQIEMGGRLRPRDIQARIRAGETAEEVAHAAGVPVEHVRRYEGPVLAEREFMARQARDVRVRRGVGTGASAPGGSAESLGAVVADRLSQREVEPDAATWDAWRADDGTWCVVLTFTAGTKQREARWSYDSSVRHVAPLDDEARWLTEDDPPASAAHRRLAPVRERVYDVESGGTARPVPEEPAAVDLLDTLRERRGRRSRPGAPDVDAGAIDPVREAIDSLMSRGELHRADANRAERAPSGRADGRADGRAQGRADGRAQDARAEAKADARSESLGADPPPAHPARSRPQDARDGEVLVLPDAEPLPSFAGDRARPSADAGAAPPSERPQVAKQGAPAGAGAGRRSPDRARPVDRGRPADRSRPTERAPADRPPMEPMDPDLSVEPFLDGEETAQETPVATGDDRRTSSSRKQRRASVPSWDDIVFGQRRD